MRPFLPASPQLQAACAHTTHRKVRLYKTALITLPSSFQPDVSLVCAARMLPLRTPVGTIAQHVCRKRARRSHKLLTKCTGSMIHPAAATCTTVLECRRTPLRSCAVAFACDRSIGCSQQVSALCARFAATASSMRANQHTGVWSFTRCSAFRCRHHSDSLPRWFMLPATSPSGKWPWSAAAADAALFSSITAQQRPALTRPQTATIRGSASVD